MLHTTHFSHQDLVQRGFLPTTQIARSGIPFQPIGACTDYEYARLPRSIQRLYTPNRHPSTGAYTYVRKQKQLTPEHEFA